MTDVDYENAPLEPPTMGDDSEEFGEPESVGIDMNRQVHHFMQSTADNFVKNHWTIAAHAAEIDGLQIALQEAKATVEAQTLHIKGVEGELEHLRFQLETSRRLADSWESRAEELENQLATPADDPQQEDAFLQATATLSGQPGLTDLGSDER
jgi:hypothetical protein